MAELTQGKSIHQSGVYRHKETGQELIAIETEKFGNPQADAYVRLGFEFVGPVEKKEDKEAVAAIPDPHAAPVATPLGVKSVAELEAELALAKVRESEAKERREEAEKVNKVAENSVADNTTEKKLDGLKKAELLEIAKEEGVEVEDNATVPQLKAAIEAKRGNK